MDTAKNVSNYEDLQNYKMERNSLSNLKKTHTYGWNQSLEFKLENLGLELSKTTQNSGVVLWIHRDTYLPPIKCTVLNNIAPESNRHWANAS